MHPLMYSAQSVDSRPLDQPATLGRAPFGVRLGFGVGVDPPGNPAVAGYLGLEAYPFGSLPWLGFGLEGQASYSEEFAILKDPETGSRQYAGRLKLLLRYPSESGRFGMFVGLGVGIGAFASRELQLCNSRTPAEQRSDSCGAKYYPSYWADRGIGMGWSYLAELGVQWNFKYASIVLAARGEGTEPAATLTLGPSVMFPLSFAAPGSTSEAAQKTRAELRAASVAPLVLASIHLRLGVQMGVGTPGDTARGVYGGLDVFPFDSANWLGFGIEGEGSSTQLKTFAGKETGDAQSAGRLRLVFRHVSDSGRLGMHAALGGGIGVYESRSLHSCLSQVDASQPNSDCNRNAYPTFLPRRGEGTAVSYLAELLFQVNFGAASLGIAARGEGTGPVAAVSLGPCVSLPIDLSTVSASSACGASCD